MNEPPRIPDEDYWTCNVHHPENDVWRRAWDIGWKIFEPKRVGRKLDPKKQLWAPLTLVHGLPTDDGRSRTVRMNRLLEAEPGTPGWNYFLNEQAARDYLPRFRVRGPKLAVSKVWVPRVAHPHLKASAPGVALCKFILLPVRFWKARQLGVDLLPKG